MSYLESIRYDRPRMSDLEKPKRRPSGAELIAAGWAAVIYATIPLVRLAREWFVERWGQAPIGYGVIIVVMIAAVVGIIGLRRLARRPRPAAIAWLIAIAAVIVWWTTRLWDHPEEAVHFLEYGLLGILIYLALRPRFPDASAYLSAALLGTLVGTVDEIIQWITPGRYWDFRDIVLNGGACALALAALWPLLPPQRRAGARSWRLPCRLAAAQIVLLTLCLANTPVRVAWYAERIPGLEFLKWPLNDMAEYGHRHHFPGLGAFNSRFTLEELQTIDAERASEVAAILDRYPRGRYSAFLRDFPAARDAFVHEARVHIFSRDRNIAQRGRQPAGSRELRRHATVALREDQILESFFTDSLRASRYRLSRAKRSELERQQLPDYFFGSKAGSHLITWISEGRLRFALLLIVFALVGVDVALGRSAPTEGANE
jgi:hypothetical protein